MEQKKPNLHAKRRERTRRRFMRHGLDVFEDHNVLELLLYFAIPRADTNPVGHRLINRFGSLSAVLDAEYDELLKIEGVGPRTAELITLMPQLAARYRQDKFHKEKGSTKLKTVAEIGDFLTTQFMIDKRERVVLLLFDNAMRLLDVIEIDKGSVNSATIDPRKIVDAISAANASACAVAHNHPSGVLIPSVEDTYSTRQLRQLFDQINVRFVEHFLIAEDRWIGLVEYMFGDEI